MATLNDAARFETQHLLELFPLSALKATWPEIPGTKEELCEKVSRRREPSRIAQFVSTNFGRCKQHVYVLKPNRKDIVALDALLPAAHLLHASGDSAIHLAEFKYSLLLDEPFSKEEFRLLWPIRIQNVKQGKTLSFVVMERDIRPFFDRPILSMRRVFDETGVVDDAGKAGYQAVDLNKGIKSLWEEDFMDAFKVRYKDPDSVASRVMDRAKGVKATKRKVYDEAMLQPLYDCSFRVSPDEKNPVEVFQAHPTLGVIKMVRYTAGEADSDELVHTILKKNR